MTGKSNLLIILAVFNAVLCTNSTLGQSDMSLKAAEVIEHYKESLSCKSISTLYPRAIPTKDLTA